MYIKGTPDYSQKGEKRDTGLFAGIVSQDGELRPTKSGKNYGTCSVRAFNRPDGSAVFMSIKSFRESTAGILANLRKGDMILAAGIISTDEYNGKSYTSMLADLILTSDSLPFSAEPSSSNPFASSSQGSDFAELGEEDGELPF